MWIYVSRRNEIKQRQITGCHLQNRAKVELKEVLGHTEEQQDVEEKREIDYEKIQQAAAKRKISEDYCVQ